MSNATFVLMNCDLVAVPLQLGAGVVTVYCGARRASSLLGGDSAFGLGSVARRDGGSSAAHTRPCNSTIARSVVPLQSG